MLNFSLESQWGIYCFHIEINPSLLQSELLIALKWFIKLVRQKVSQPKDIHPYTRPTCKVRFHLRKITILALVLGISGVTICLCQRGSDSWAVLCAACVHTHKVLPHCLDDHDDLDQLDDLDDRMCACYKCEWQKCHLPWNLTNNPSSFLSIYRRICPFNI